MLESLSEFVGQEQLKKRLNIEIMASVIRSLPFPHLLMAGSPGLGKTTLAKIIAKECGAEFFGYLATSIEGEKQISAIFSNLSKDGYNLRTGEVEDRAKIKHCVIFIDEIHNLKKKTIEMLHTALENRTLTVKLKNFISGMVEPTVCWIPEFTLIGATNYLGSLPKPFRDRFRLSVTMEDYTPEEIFTLLSNLAEKNKVKITKEAKEELAKKSRGVPRIAISFYEKSISTMVALGEDVVDKECVEYMFSCEEIDDIGLNRMDRKALTYLSTVPRPIGLKAFAQAIDEDMQTVENVIEPYLVRLGFIVRTGSGRYLTDEGKRHIGRERMMSLYPIQK